MATGGALCAKIWVTNVSDKSPNEIQARFMMIPLRTIMVEGNALELD
jgi:hypothetical protein